MSKSLVIVESPAKIKTLKQFLGANFIFESSFGHIRDLPENSFGIDIEQRFEPTYIPLPDKKTVIAKLKKAAKECDTVYLSPDPDREGEAIAWHISQILGPKANVKRVSFNSITKDAVVEALAHPTEIDMALVNAQQARRLLDRLVGYTLSPLISRKLGRRGKEAVSAGRVQSVALKLVVDREKAIEAFVPVEYWNIAAQVKAEPNSQTFSAALFSIDGKKVEKEPKEGSTAIPNEETSASIKKALEECSPYTVMRVDKKERRRMPEAPFITSTLQQEASRHFRFSPTRTMQIAQMLYEGIDLHTGSEGLITYMRTDSVRTAPEALNEVRQYISSQLGAHLLPDEPRKFSVKKSAQDAHEAIRPTHVNRTPDSVKQFLTKDQFLLYSLIWRRFVASQMAHALYDTVSCDIKADDHYLLRATGSQLKEPGFLSLYEEKVDEESEKDEHRPIPELSIGQHLLLDSVTADQAFTRPPPRFTEATLIKELEKSGIGRPSTYAAIMKKISARDYTTKEQSRLRPTELGRVVTDMLETSFPDLMSVGFTALMEDSLEEVAENHKEWRDVLASFWNDFSKTLETAKEQARPQKVMTDILCPKCSAPLQKVWFHTKYFLGCSRYPECDYSTSIEESQFDKSEYKEDFDWDQLCPKCQSPMKVRFGKYGAFLGCTKYPECRGVVRIPKKGEETASGHPCPAIGCDGTLVQRRSRFGKLFWSCSNFPNCDVAGSSLELVEGKFHEHPKTPYVSKKKAKSEDKPAKKTAGAKKSSKRRTTQKKVKKSEEEKELADS
jgi:DNA topoisomerase I